MGSSYTHRNKEVSMARRNNGAEQAKVAVLLYALTCVMLRAFSGLLPMPTPQTRPAGVG